MMIWQTGTKEGTTVRILVTGGTGHLGRDIVSLLNDQGHQVRVLARAPGQDPSVEWILGDLATGRGITEAVSGTEVIVHAASLSPVAGRGTIRPVDLVRSPTEVDIGGTRQLLGAAGQAGVAHFLYVSIVGVQHARMPYSRLKAAAEDLVRQSGVPHSIVPATQFYWLLDRMLSRMARLPVWPLPTKLPMQPCHDGDFAAYVVECVAAGPGGDRQPFGGPDILSFGHVAEQYEAARRLRRRILPMPLPRAVLHAAGDLTCPDGRRGTTTWAEWLSRHPARPE
jgi:uncharacterized protein YbjT (DUF2867 family)